MISRTLAMADGVMFSGVALVSVTGTFAESVVIAAVAVAMCGFSLVLNSASKLFSNPVLTLLPQRVLKQERFGPILLIGCSRFRIGRNYAG
jgi:hypothetical protein